MEQVRRKQSIWVGIVVVLVFFACVTFAVSWVGSSGPDFPHPADVSATCVSCHPLDRLPEGHEDRSVDGCRSCHAEEG